MRLLLTCVALLLAAGCSGPTSSDGDASCADLADYRGERYAGHGELRRMPQTAGPVGTATRVTCDDGNGESEATEMDVEELADVPLDRAFLSHGQLYVRQDLGFPEAARAWFEKTPCDEDGRFELTGQWLGVRSPNEARFDGDLRPPYRITAWVVEGPAAYVDTLVTVHATESTDPPLGPEDVKGSLWEGGDVTARVHCEDGRFVADGLSTTG
ncbi:MAG: hypothetical protein ACXWW7_08270 [Nocardioides sp.]